MPPASDKVVALRRLLEERHGASRPRPARLVATGVPALDDLLGGGLRTGALTEFVSENPSAGSQTSVGSLLLTTRVARQRVALIDASGAFALDGLDDDLLSHVVWVRCQDLSHCWRAADLTTRDPNYAVTIVDVRGRPVRELLRTRDSVWVRLQRAAEHAETALVVQSESGIVPNAAFRIAFETPLNPGALLQPRHAIIADLAPALQRRRLRAVEGIA